MTADRVKNPFETVLGWIWYLTGSIEQLAVFGILELMSQKGCKKTKYHTNMTLLIERVYFFRRISLLTYGREYY
jgi:hypothetical protein